MRFFAVFFILLRAASICHHGKRGLPAAEDRSKKGIASQAVCSVIGAGTFPGRIEPGQIRPVLLIHQNAAHKIMDSRRYRNRFPGRVDAKIVQDLLPEIGKPDRPCLPAQAGEIQIYLLSEHCHFPGDHITRHKIAALSVFLLKKIDLFPVRRSFFIVKEPASLSAGSF